MISRHSLAAYLRLAAARKNRKLDARIEKALRPYDDRGNLACHDCAIREGRIYCLDILGGYCAKRR